MPQVISRWSLTMSEVYPLYCAIQALVEGQSKGSTIHCRDGRFWLGTDPRNGRPLVNFQPTIGEDITFLAENFLRAIELAGARNLILEWELKLLRWVKVATVVGAVVALVAEALVADGWPRAVSFLLAIGCGVSYKLCSRWEQQAWVELAKPPVVEIFVGGEVVNDDEAE